MTNATLATAPRPAVGAPDGPAGVMSQRVSRRVHEGPNARPQRDGDAHAEQPEVLRIVTRAKAGDTEAFAQLYDCYSSLVYRYVYHRVGTPSLAEDLTSETFLRALRRITSFTWQGKDFAAWLVTIARNLVTDHYKSARFRLEFSTGEMLDADRVEEGPERAVLDSITRAALLETIGRLDTDQRHCVVLRFLHGLSIAETAVAMDRREGAVKALQYRAVRSLARMFAA